MQTDLITRIIDSPAAGAAIGLSVLAGIALILHLVARPLILRLTKQLVQRTRVEWDGIFFDAKLPHRLSYMIPLLALQIGLDWVPSLPPVLHDFLIRLLNAATILVGALAIDSLLTAAHTIYLRTPSATARPIKSYVQLTKVLVYSVAAIFMIARLANQSPWYFVSGLGALMAIILLVFRDTILSFVAGIQLTHNDLIRVGDWIEMPQFDADGDVIDISLHTVKVENWDKTVTVIPTHKFLEHSFKNWRNMFDRGGRRIKRAIYINTSTIRFLTQEEIERLSRFELLRDYLRTKQAEIDEYNRKHGFDTSVVVNGRRLTNIGTLRAYIIAYLRNHPGIRSDFTFLVRQLAPTPEGVPLEIYVFTRDTRWAVYESIQADIFDHILAVVPEFGLKVYQRPAGNDFVGLVDDAVLTAVRT